MKMKQGKTLLLTDAIINFILGIMLLAYSQPLVDFLGIPFTENRFYPNILGAVLFGIGIALIIQYRKKGEMKGLGLEGAISINLSGGIVLFFWLIAGKLYIPLHGRVVLWVLDIILVGISSLELIAGISSGKKTL